MASITHSITTALAARPVAWFCVLALPFLLAAASALVVDFVATREPVAADAFAAAGFPPPATFFAFAQLHVVVVGLLAELAARSRGPVAWQRGAEDQPATGVARS
jgi:hypothetical protein